MAGELHQHSHRLSGLGRGRPPVPFKLLSNSPAVVPAVRGLWLEEVSKTGGLIGPSSCVGPSGGLCGDDRACDMSGSITLVLINFSPPSLFSVHSLLGLGCLTRM